MSSSDDYDDEWSTFKSVINDSISNVKSAGSFATSGSFENVILPGIAVDEIGAIPIPLSSQAAESLIRVGRRAPFGKNDKTLVDETVRKTWEIDGSKVSFSNEVWHDWLKVMVKKAAKELGVPCNPDNVQAELYKMLLYEEGAMFKPHRDTEKTPGMFGTLIICLPSEHTGGAVHIKHGQKEKKFETSKLSSFNITYIAWYADVVHEIKPVESGYRWVLTYNLINAGTSSSISAAALDAQTARFRQVIAEWRDFDDAPDCLCYAFDYQYTDVGLKLASLKGDDYSRALYVTQGCGDTGEFCVLLASLQTVVEIPTCESGDEDKSSTLQLVRIYDTEGLMLRQWLPLSEEYLLQPELYHEREPDKQTGGEHLGNQNADIEQVYNDTVMLIVPRRTFPRFLRRGANSVADFKNLLQGLLRYLKMRNNDPLVRDLIIQVCQHGIVRPCRQNAGEVSISDHIAHTAILISNQGLFSKAVHSATQGLAESTFSVLGELICLQAPVVPEDCIIEAFSTVPMLYKTHRCLQEFSDGFFRKNANRSDEGQAQHLASWVRNRISVALKSLPKAHPQDAAALIEIASKYDDKMLEEFLNPFIARFSGDSDFVNALAVEILSYSQSSSSNKEVVANLSPVLLDPAVAHFKLLKYSSARKRQCPPKDYPYSSWPNCSEDEERRRLDASIVAGLYQKLLQPDPKKAFQLLGKIRLQAEDLPQQELERLAITLLGVMIHIVDRHLPEVHKFYQSVMATYMTKIVKNEPEKPRDWSRSTEGIYCWQSNCSFCSSLKQFLMDAGEESRRFILTDDGRHHSVPDECKKSFDESQKPKVLIVTKTLKAWEKSHGAWQKRASKAQEAFEKLPNEELRQCLGESYDAIMDLRMIKLQSEGSTSLDTDMAETSSGDLSREQLDSIVPQKRTQSVS